MKYVKAMFLAFAVLMIAVLITVGCGTNPSSDGEGGGGGNKDTIAPTVISTNPADLATGVVINSNVTATFSEAMDTLTITTATFTLMQGTTPVPCAVTYAGNVATLNPTNDLTISTVYTVTITTGVKDIAGNSLAANKIWTFTTGATLDITAPTVISTIPADLAINAPINGNVTATFSEAMDTLTITTATFTLMQGTTPVPCAVTYAGNVATLNPTNDLAISTVFTVTITSGVKDMAGNSLAVNKIWTFTTASGAALGPAPVILGTAGNFVIFSKTGIFNVPTSAVTGDIGVCPISFAAITGFTLSPSDNLSAFSTTPEVIGKVYASDYAVPTPTYVDTARIDMEAAYTDAAGRTTPDFIDPGTAGEIGGLILAPGLYNWTSSVTISSNVTLNGGPNDVWIFQIAGTLGMASGKQVLLTGGAQPKNIFWQTTGAVLIDTTALLQGIVLTATAVTMNTGATVNGRLLAQTAVSLGQCTVTQPAP